MNLEAYAEVREDVKNRFLRYVQIDTQSDGASETIPSTEKQKDLGLILEEELKEIGLVDVSMDDNGYVFATLESNIEGEDNIPIVGFLAHMDTSPDAPGANVKPQIHENYGGGVINLEEGVFLDPSLDMRLNNYIGDELITSDGTTLLGADDKAGIAEVMAAVKYLKDHSEIKHGKIRVAFTPDEEIGQGAKHFDIDKFGAKYAYTLDASELGEYSDETFAAKRAIITIKGVQKHPGYAFEKMVNPSTVAHELLSELPINERPETTEGQEGFYCVLKINSNLESGTIELLLRDFDDEKLAGRAETLRNLRDKYNLKYDGVEVSVAIRDEYPNMKKFIVDPEIIDIPLQAMERLGIEPKHKFTRGGTDGSSLSANGLPTPNLFAGMENIHSNKEFVSVETMVAAVGTIVEIAKGYAQKYVA